jgi:hypothetical protein
MVFPFQTIYLAIIKPIGKWKFCRYSSIKIKRMSKGKESD